MLLITILVLWVLVMGIWMLLLLDVIAGSNPKASGWLGWFGVLLLGIVVFLVGSGTVVWPR